MIMLLDHKSGFSPWISVLLHTSKSCWSRAPRFHTSAGIQSTLGHLFLEGEVTVSLSYPMVNLLVLIGSVSSSY